MDNYKDIEVEFSLRRFLVDYYVQKATEDAMINEILANQARILALLENRDLEEVKKEIWDRVDENTKVSNEAMIEYLKGRENRNTEES